MKLFFATPTYSMTVFAEFTKSLMATCEYLRGSGIDYLPWEHFSGCCYLPVARNKLIKQFLESDATDLIFLDADISWEPWSLSQLLKHDAEIVAGAYRFKGNIEGYPVYLKKDKDDLICIDAKTGLLDVHYAPTGFMRIHRGVFERYQVKFNDRLPIEEWRDGVKCNDYLNFFDCRHDVEAKRWFGEDVNFCYLVPAIGCKVLVEPDINITHWGICGWSGNYKQFLNLPDLRPQEDKVILETMLTKPKTDLEIAAEKGIEPQRIIGLFPSEDHPYPGNDIYGWMSLTELRWLYDRAGKFDSILEIGSYNGRSSHALAAGSMENQAKLHFVDSWESMSHVYGFENDTLEKAEGRYVGFLQMLTKIPGVDSRTSVYRETSIEASKRFENESVDMIFIDGDHTTESVIQDVLHWLPKARKLICGHDYSDTWHEVKRAINGIFGADKVKVIDTIWYIELESVEAQ